MMLRLYVESPEGDLEGFADECQDLDGRFKLTDDEGETWYTNGWCCHVEIVENYPTRY